MFVIGTAGHIDHGKSSLILRLTGIDPDRLPEEKKRAMTIDLGFAWYDTPDGQRIGIVDVPGHERFVRNMIAGAGGIDAVILVVAADDGWMPQSQEHLHITELLGVKHGFVALTKVDLADADWVELVSEDIRSKLEGTFLDGQPIIKVSSVSGDGFDELINEINNLASSIVEREDIEKPRLYIDRSFILPGMGGVATGTLKGGHLSIGDEISVFPALKTGRIRSIQSHNMQVEQAAPGQRTALALTGVDHKYLVRGGVVSPARLIDSYPDNPILAVKLNVLDNSPISVLDRRRLLMIIGTTEVEGEIRTYADAGIPIGRSGVAFFKPFEPVFAFVGDRFIVRMPTPQVTVGGGTVLDHLDFFPRRKDLPKYDYLNKRAEDDSLGTLVQSEFDKGIFISINDLLLSNYSQDNIRACLNDLGKSGVVDTSGDRYYRIDDIQNTQNSLLDNIRSMLEVKPHLNGVKPDDIAKSMAVDLRSLAPIIELLLEKNKLIKKGNNIDLPDRKAEIKGELKAVSESILSELSKDNFAPPFIQELLGSDKDRREAFNYLLSTNQIIKINTDLVYTTAAWSKIVSAIRNLMGIRNQMVVKDLRDTLGCSRKYLIPILEYTDNIGLTRREGDIRVKGDNFEKE